MKRSNLKIIGVEESKDPQLKGPVKTFSKIIEEKFPNLKKEMSIIIKGANSTPKNWTRKQFLLSLNN